MRSVSERRAGRIVAFAALVLLASAARAGAPPLPPGHAPLPEQAVCAVCAAHGAAHGPERIAAHRDRDGACYAFCSKKCAEAFDADPAAFVPLPLPRPAPEAAFATPAGGTQALAALRGRVVLLDFWASWCAPCVKAFPDLARLQADLGDRGLTVLGVCIDEDAKARDRLLAKKRPAHTIVFDGGETPAWQAFGVRAVPAAFLVDRSGRIVRQWTGAVPAPEVRAAIETLLAAE